MTTRSSAQENRLAMPYQTLSHDHDEIRVLYFDNNPDPAVTVSCSLRVVSLQDLHKEFDSFLIECRSFCSWPPPSPPADAARQFDEWIAWSQHHVDKAYRLPLSRFKYARVESQTGTLDILPRFTWGEFEALSYCWESEALEAEILLDGVLRQVPRNLEAALQALRVLPEVQQGMHIWVDFLCIDQTNDVEKGHQVRMMRQIYARAMSVIAWLGTDSEASADVINIKRLNYEHGNPMSFPNGFSRKIEDVLSLQYFQRLWIIQELAVNKNMTVFLCGKNAFSRDEIVTFCEWVMRHAVHLDEARETLQDGAQSVSVQRLRQEESTWYPADAVRRLLGNNTCTDVDTVLDLGRRASAQKDVDKLYGLLGLMPEHIQNTIWPDYSLTVETLYPKFAETLADSQGRLDAILSWAGVEAESTVPTWCPDWRIRFTRNHVYHIRSRAACKTKSAEVSHSPTHLCCRGILVDTIDATGNRSSSLDMDQPTLEPRAGFSLPFADHPNRYDHRIELTLDSANLQWPRTTKALLDCLTINHFSISDSLCQLANQNNDEYADLACEFAYPCGAINPTVVNTPADRWWQRLHRFLRNHADFSLMGCDLNRIFLPNDVSQPEVHPWQPGSVQLQDIMLMSLNLVYRILVTTETGFLGLAPDHTVAGDVIAILYGCNFPVVLRPVGSNYKYIGECYVSGIMDGEVIDALERGEYNESLITLI